MKPKVGPTPYRARATVYITKAAGLSLELRRNSRRDFQGLPYYHGTMFGAFVVISGEGDQPGGRDRDRYSYRCRVRAVSCPAGFMDRQQGQDRVQLLVGTGSRSCHDAENLLPGWTGLRLVGDSFFCSSDEVFLCMASHLFNALSCSSLVRGSYSCRGAEPHIG